MEMSFKTQIEYLVDKGRKSFDDLTNEETWVLVQALIRQEDAAHREECITQADDLDLYPELLISSPERFLEAVKRGVIEYYRDAIQSSLEEEVDYRESSDYQWEQFLGRLESAHVYADGPKRLPLPRLKLQVGGAA